MTAEQIKKLAAARLSVEQIAAVAEIMEPRKPPKRLCDCSPEEYKAVMEGLAQAERDGTVERDADGRMSWPVRLPGRMEANIATEVQHGELTVWVDETKDAYVKAYNEENRP